MRHILWFIVILEDFTASDAKVAYMMITICLQRIFDLFKISPFLKHNINIQDRFGSQAGDGGAADVFDPHVNSGEDLEQVCLQLLEPILPGRVPRHYFHPLGRSGTQSGFASIFVQR